ncbi:thermonuclease family protein [Pontibacter liquoris]|uniref:thermonuclease family protein n=1 Tax=Pontibacter liquoris TaxID=2905677 RepID=UPI001FA7B644|nr:thermonuclease family protein [Pontibacter liquoris]
MKKHLTFILLLLSSLTFSCKHNQQDAQEQFRKRQEAIQERTPENSSAETTPSQSASPDTLLPAPATMEAAPAAKPSTAAGDKVVGVKDGDTIVLLQNGQQVTVRLYGVDTPEKTQDFGQRAKQFTSDLAFGKFVRLIPKNKDRYGRTVGTIILPDGRSLNEELVRNGFAWHYKAYSTDKKLADLETDARRFKRGLWQSPNPTPPWDYRKDKRSSGAAKAVANANAPVPAGATKRTVYLCSSSGATVYYFKKDCPGLRRCKQDVIAVTESEAIRTYNRHADKTCGQ